jgi:hypothetical protein
VIRTACFHGDVDGGVTKIHTVVGAVVSGLYDIGAMVRQDSSQLVQSAGIVRKVDSQSYEASIFHQAALDDPREQGDIDIASADEHSDALALQGKLSVQDRRDGGCASAFCEGLFTLKQQKNRVGDLLFLNGDDVVDVFLN